MLKRLLVLAAVIAAFFVFVPTSSAQTTTPTLPTECLNIATPGDVTQNCLDALAGLTGGGGGSTLPEECQGILGVIGGGTGGGTGGGGTVPLLDQLTATQLLQLVGCLTALTGGGDDEEEEPVEDGNLEEQTGDVGTAGYGGDLGVEGYGGDEGDFPAGGVESGFGPTGSDEPGAPLAARGAALLVLLGVLATGLVVMRRRRSGS